MVETFAVVIAALVLAFSLARHDPKMFEGTSAGALAVIWPFVGLLFGWDFALTFAHIQLKSALDPAAFAKARAALDHLTLPVGAPSAAMMGAIGLQIIRAFAKPKP